MKLNFHGNNCCNIFELDNTFDWSNRVNGRIKLILERV